MPKDEIIKIFILDLVTKIWSILILFKSQSLKTNTKFNTIY